MKALRNLGHHEQIIRVGVGIVLLALSGFSILPGWGDLLLMMGGLIALMTGIIGYCPAWHTFGINSCKVTHDHSDSKPEEGLHVQSTSTTHQS